MSSLTAHSASAGAPLAGLTPAWVAYLNATTGVAIGLQATLVDLGGGLYRVDGLSSVACGILDLGATARPRYVLVGSDDETVVAAFDATGAPLAGLTLAWASYVDEATGAAVTPQPTFTPLGSGLYRIDGIGTGTVGVLDLGATALDRYPQLGGPVAAGVGDTTAPVISNVTPATGTTIGRTATLGLDVTDATNALRRVIIIASFPARGLVDLVHDGAAFAPLYAGGSTRSTLGLGYRYALARAGGWPADVTLAVYAIDEAGNEAPLPSLAWPLAQAPAPVTSTSTSSAASQARDLRLDDDGDLFIGSGDLAHVSGIDAIAQSLKIRLRLIRGEWFLDTAAGIPLFDQVLVKNPRVNLLRGIYRDAILAAPGVRALPELKLDLDSARRTLTIRYRATTDLGELIGSVGGSP
jgi:hypothetical protein